MTEPIYYSEPYTRTVSSRVIAVLPYKDHWAVELDRTIFYPEGGGQPGDRGHIDGYEIHDTIKQDGRILHLCRTQPQLATGDQVSCVLDWDFRYDYMQQHTGQHILSGVMYRLYHIGTLAVHQGLEYVTIETDREQITPEEQEAIEDEANRMICLNLPVWYDQKDEEEVSRIPLRRAPKVAGSIRLVTIDSCDIAACGGVHLKRTGEARLIRIISSESIRGRVRLAFKIGSRAMEDYRSKDRIVQSLSRLYSAKEPEIVEQSEKRLDQLKELQQRYLSLERRYTAALLAQAIEAAEELGGIRVAALDLTGENPGFLKGLAKALPQERPAALCAVQEQEHGELQWLITVTEGVPFDAAVMRGTLFPLIGAKGGGKPPVWQGKGTEAAGKQQFLSAFKGLFMA
jgi:alanyl-tRNA synthetase